MIVKNLIDHISLQTIQHIVKTYRNNTLKPDFVDSKNTAL